jgi:uncharacterized protein YqgV (UPF0045/DUF77 family)
MWTELFNVLIEIAVVVMSTAVTVLIRYGIAYLSANTKDRKVQLALQELQTVMIDGVQYTEQTFVTPMKENGEWDCDAQKAALQKAAEYVVQNLTKSTKKLVASDKDDLQTWIEQKIESYIRSMK